MVKPRTRQQLLDIIVQVVGWSAAALIQDCFRDLAVTLEYRAEVYQYVGDEAVLCWEAPAGALPTSADFTFQAVGTMQLRGRQAPVDVYAVRRAGSGKDATDAARHA